MNQTLEKIIAEIKLSPEDKEGFGISALELVKRHSFLHNPNNNFECLRSFLEDVIPFLKIQATFLTKYSPQIYHENVGISRRCECEIYAEILNRLKQI